MVLEVVAILAAVAVVLVPGACLLLLVGVRRPVWLALLAAPSSVALASITGIVTAGLGARFGVVPLAVAAALCGVGGAARSAVRSRRRAARPSRTTTLRPVTAILLAALTTVAGLGVSVATWLGGWGWSLRSYPQEHDMIFHLALSSYVARSGVGAPWELAPTDVLTGSAPLFYPAGFHLLAGALTQVTGDVVIAVNALALVLVAIGLPLAIGALTAAAGRAAGFGPSSALGAGAAAVVVSATLYRPGVQLAHDGGILPNAVAFTLAAAVLAVVVSWRRVPPSVMVGSGLAAAGSAAVHPSALVTIAVTSAAFLAVDVLRRGRRDLVRVAQAFWPTALVGALVAAPTLVLGSSAVAKTTSFDSQTPDRPVALGLGKALTFAYGGYLDPDSARAQVLAALLILIGIGALVLGRRCAGLIAALLVWFVIVMSYFVAPGKGPAGIVTGFFYNSEPRVWSHLTLIGVPAGALGLVLVARRIAAGLPSVTRGRVPVVAAVLLTVLLAGYLAGPGYGYARINETAVASRFATPDFTRVDGDDEAAAAWLAENVQPGERVLNSANDGSTVLYTEFGVPVVNLATLGSATAPYTTDLLADFRTFPTNPRVRTELRDLDVRWLYVDAEAPPIGVGGAPGNWPQTDRLTVPRGFLDLEGLPGLQPAFRAGSVTVYRLDPAVVLAP